METFRIEHYLVNVDFKEYTKPGEEVAVTIKSTRTNAVYSSVYSLLVYPFDTAIDLAKRAFIHYKMGTKPDQKCK